MKQGRPSSFYPLRQSGFRYAGFIAFWPVAPGCCGIASSSGLAGFAATKLSRAQYKYRLIFFFHTTKVEI
jgi:hypothetical protein